MAELRDVVAYLCQNYPRPGELSKARLTKMVYLADWRSAITRGRQVTRIVWEFHQYGPYVDDIVSMARSDPAFEVSAGSTPYGTGKETIRLIESFGYASLDKADRRVLDFVIDKTAPKTWEEFMRLVYSTYPIITQPRYAKLNLVDLARRYQKDRPMFDIA